MINKVLSHRLAWVYLTLFYSSSFFLLDEFFVQILQNYVDENVDGERLFYHRSALFVIVSAFILWTQYTLVQLVRLNQSLIESERLATLGEMSAAMAHELVRPLTVLRLEADLCLSKSKIHPELEKFSGNVIRQINRCTTVIDSLRDFGQGQTNSVKFTADLNEICQSSCQFTRPFIGFLEVTTNLVSDLPNIFVSANQIEQVISNLLVNAKDAIDDYGEGSIHLSTQVNDSKVILEIKNTGPTISKSLLPKLFDPFFTTKSKKRGTGLGLAISKRIMDEHNASITVTSKNGLTCFTLSFPRAQDKGVS